MISIVTDSTVYMTQEEAGALGATVVPEGYYVSGKTYEETYADKNGDYQKLIRENTGCKTFHTNNNIFSDTFKGLLNGGNEILCITISSKLSGTYSSALISARETGGGKIAVVDSLCTAGGLFLLVKKAAELIKSGMALFQAAQEIESMREKICILFSVDDMLPLRNSGRLGIIYKSVNTILNIKPLLMCIKGSIILKGVARGNSEQTGQMLKYIPLDSEEIIIHTINNFTLAGKLIKMLREKGYTGRISQRVLGPVLGIHLGLGVIGAVWVKK